jgi:hypothetical protein
MAGAIGLGPVATLSLSLRALLGFRLLLKSIDIPEWEQRLGEADAR